MEKNPKQLNPLDPRIKTYPGQDLNNGVEPKVTDLLPAIFRTETNKKVLSAIVEDLFQPSSLETLNFSVGRKTSKTIVNDYLPHPNANRQVETGLVVYTEAGVETLSSDELCKAWDFDNREKESPVPIGILDLPIDPDKFVNWSDYYWIEEGMPVLFITGGADTTFNVEQDIIGKQYYTTPVQRNGRQLELKNGMRIAFQQHPYQQAISGHGKLEYVSIGAQVDPLGYELTSYDKQIIGISINGEIVNQNVDYFIVGNEIHWVNGPVAGDSIYVHLADYYITRDEDQQIRRWQVEGVGTEGGIRLLGRTHQNTRTVYSGVSDTLWDQTAVPWDRYEWDGSIPGINAKHYILQKVGAETRNAHSRVNVWYHKDSIQTVADFLDIRFSDIARSTGKALRPIVEFENNLELFDHGTTYRAWVGSVERTIVDPSSLINKTVRQANVELGLALQTTSGRLLNTAPRILWLTEGSEYANKIINFRTENGKISNFIVESVNDNDVVVVSSATVAVPPSMEEFYWKDGVATLATFRKSIVEQPLFELYSKEGISLSGYDQATGFKPTLIKSNIIKIVQGDTPDSESGYKLKFLPSQFNQLSSDNTAKNAMYDIVYQHTQHDYAYYIDTDGVQRTVDGPYSFRRVQGKELSQELSNGYAQAWFRLKSWAIRTSEINGLTEIILDASMWPTYKWALSVDNDKLKVLHTDTLKQAPNNYAVVARGEQVTFDVYVPGASTAIISSTTFANFTVDVVDGKIQFVVPDDAGDTLTLTIDDKHIVARVINTNQDPRNIQVKLNGLPAEYTTTVVRVGNAVTNFSIEVEGTGVVEIKHQGNLINNDHLTAIPGFEYNPEQISSLGEFTPSRIVHGMIAAVNATKQKDQAWINSPQVRGANGIYIAEHSSIRAGWASFKLSPTVQDVLISRSLSSWRWYRKFISKLEEHINLLDLENKSSREALDRILEELLLGATYSSTDAVTGMAFTTGAMTPFGFIGNSVTTVVPLGDTVSLYTGVYGPDHVYVYVDGTLLTHGVEYTLDSATNSVVFADAPATDALVEIFHASEISVYTAIPASPAKLGLSGLYEPKIVTETWGTNSRSFIQRHDGSRISVFITDAGVPDEDYYPNKIILELEKRIYNGCLNKVGKENRQRQVRNYKANTVLESQSRAQLEWYATNNLNYRDRNDYVSDDAWTWNYSGNSWRGLYIKHFGTYELHSSPWEALGFDNSPSWWNTHYSWTDTNKRTALEYALQNGIISEPNTPVTVDPTVRREFDTFPVNTTGELQDPVTWGVTAPSADEAQQPWEIGSWGPVELAWRRSIAGAWSDVLYAVDDYNIISEFFDNSINPFVENLHFDNNSVKPKGYNSLAPSQFFQDRPSIGIGAAIFEAYREFNLVGETPLLDLMSINPRLQFSMGGFTDGDFSLKMPYTKFQSGSYVPTEDVFLTLSSGVPLQVLRYSSVRVERDDVGFRVYGFDPAQRFFTVFKPTERSMTSSFPSSRRALPTAYGEFIEYLEWQQTEVHIPYGSYIANKQDLITFMMGLGEYQQSKGLILDSINERGTVTDWKQAAIDALGWSEENWADTHYCVVGVATNDGLKFKHERGTLDRLDADLGRTGKILFNSGRSALASELLITRDFETDVDKIVPTVNDQIVFADFKIREYDHVVYINRKTKFGDMIVDLQTGSRLDTLKLSGRRTYNWTGRPNARGILPQENGILPSFDTIISDIIESHKPELSAFDTFKTRVARSNAVPSKESVIFDIIQDNTTAHLYRQGLQSASGTNLAIDALFRNNIIDIPGRIQDLSVNEQWMFDSGEFGRLSSQRIWEIELRKEDITSARQIVRFKDVTRPGEKDLRGDNIIDLIGPRDPRWVSRPLDVKFKTLDREAIEQDPEYAKINNWLPSAGIAELADTDVQTLYLDNVSFDDFKALDTKTASNSTLTTKDLFETLSYSKYTDYQVGDYTWYKAVLKKANSKIVGSATNEFDSTLWESVSVDGSILPSIWVSEYNGEGWNVLQTLAPVFVEEACPNAIDTGLNESKITFASPHNLSLNDTFILAGSGDGNYDKFHKVKEVVDDYNVLIEGRSTSGEIVYDLVAYKLGTVKFNSETEWQASSIQFSAGMKAYIDYGDIEGKWKIITYIADGDDVGSSPDIVERYSGPMVDTRDISRVQLIDYDSQEVLTSVEVFDPYKGLTIDEVTQYIDYSQEVDPAIYNITDLGEPDEYASESWGVNKIGALWWDLSQVRYIEYEQTDDIQYRASHWGEKFANSKVVVYEWALSTEIPTVDQFPYARLDTSSGNGQIRYSEQTIYDPISNAPTTLYFFWNGNVSDLPPSARRPYTASSIQFVLNDPDASSVAWVSPIQENAILLANINSFFGSKDKLVLRVEQTSSPEQIHTNQVLVTEGFNGDIIDNYLFHRLESSVTGRDNYRETYPIKQFTPGVNYSRGDYVCDFNNGEVYKTNDYSGTDYPVLRNLNDTRYDVTAIWKSKNGADHKIYYVPRDFHATGLTADVNGKNLIKSSASALIKNILELEANQYYAVINTRRRVPSQELHPLRRYGNGYTPRPQSWFKDIVDARRTLVTAANDYLLNIDVVSKPNWDRYLRIYRPLSGIYTKDLTKYWKYVDYVATDYIPGKETTRLISSLEIGNLDSTVTNFAIVDSANNTLEAYDKDGDDITLVYRRNGTIQFLDAVWDGSLGDAWDRARWDKNAWDEDASEVVESILRALRYNIFTEADVGYFNLLFFAMVKESLVQVPTANWVSKTTYLDVIQTSSNDLRPVAMFYNKKDAIIKKYLNEVKPFHSKIVDTNQFSKSTVTVPISIGESIDLTITTATAMGTEDDNIVATENNRGLATRIDVTEQSLTEEG
jgi:hypothetical protein